MRRLMVLRSIIALQGTIPKESAQDLIRDGSRFLTDRALQITGHASQEKLDSDSTCVRSTSRRGTVPPQTQLAQGVAGLMRGRPSSLSRLPEVRKHHDAQDCG